MVEFYCLLDEEGVDADPAGRDDHGDATHGQHAQGIDDRKMAGGADGEKAHPGTQEIHAPDTHGIDEEQRFVPDVFHTYQAVPDVQEDGTDLPDGGDVLKPFEGPATCQEEEERDGDDPGDLDPGDLAVLITEKQIRIPRGERMDDIVLEDQREAKDGSQADDVEGSFGYNGPDELICGDLFIPGEDGAFDHLAKTRGAEIDKIADHDAEETVDAGRIIAQGLDELTPPEGTQPVAEQQKAEYGHQQPVIGTVEGVFELRPFLGVHAF